MTGRRRGWLVSNGILCESIASNAALTGLVDVWQNTTTGNDGAYERVELLITTNGELQMTRRDTLHFEILGRVSCQFQQFGSEVLEDGAHVDGCFRSDADIVLCTRLEVTVNSSNGELRVGETRGEHWFLAMASSVHHARFASYLQSSTSTLRDGRRLLLIAVAASSTDGRRCGRHDV